MIYERFHVAFVGVVATLVDSVVVAEFAGYWLYRLLHSDKFPSLRKWSPKNLNWRSSRVTDSSS